jgi:4-hydroxy-tetrahydrodipicolinate reductase
VTGHSPAQQAQIKEASATIPIVYSSNFSVAVNLLLELAARSTQLAAYGFEPILTEQHAVHKKDTPSGTAKNLLAHMEATGLLGTRGVELRSVREDAPDAIHHLCWQGHNESLTLLHHAKDRRPFALGALRAAAWVAQQTKPGLYGMPAVLGWETPASLGSCPAALVDALPGAS